MSLFAHENGTYEVKTYFSCTVTSCNVNFNEVLSVDKIIETVFLSGRIVCLGLAGLGNQVKGNTYKLSADVRQVEFP